MIKDKCPFEVRVRQVVLWTYAACMHGAPPVMRARARGSQGLGACTCATRVAIKLACGRSQTRPALDSPWLVASLSSNRSTTHPRETTRPPRRSMRYGGLRPRARWIATPTATPEGLLVASAIVLFSPADRAPSKRATGSQAGSKIARQSGQAEHAIN